MRENKKKEKKILYLGLDPSRYKSEGKVVHLPIIRIVSRSFEEVEKIFLELASCSHVLFTSRSSISLFFAFSKKIKLSLKRLDWIVIGKATQEKLEEYNVRNILCAKEETAEGVARLLDTVSIQKLFFPHSARSRDFLFQFLKEKKIPHLASPLYDTKSNPIEIPPEEEWEEIVFTSPSTVDAYLELKKKLPPLEKCRAIGPITKAYLEHTLRKKITHEKKK